MQTEVVANRVVAASEFNDSSRSGVSWGAVLAGAAAAASLSYILVILGFGLGLSSVSPWTNAGASSTALGVATIVWLTFTQVAASAMGGYLAGRLRVKWASVHTDEVYFRDTAHGFLSWAVASLVVAAFLASAVGGILSGGASAVGSAMGSAAGGAGQAIAAAAPSLADIASDNGDYAVDTLFRTTGAPGNASGSSPSTPEVDSSAAEARAETGMIFAHSLATGSLSAADKQYVGQKIAARTGVSQADAEKQVDAAFASTMQSVETAKAKAKEVADQARKATAGLSLWMFISLLCEAFSASLAATFGGRRRDL